ncbi:hypothetical protein EQW78_10655 [Oerskovia turbata]|uniref:Uncharacterized protein n=1 Tax=Oerskovia turbata TaxID=1713 RepID=A0A4Q1KU79_9CELL|nr:MULTISPECIES: hypothetical protein [Oerskovia]QDW63226.1 hypothetical protein FFI11_012500 [Oerskovia sp. KBS0722]RXR23777.1 hypothetical protein EQW73_14245 [Oerskovia turbata]RXR33753.1 hypothetical protein EQW78_10655 [Oerskovia turbata]
MQEIDWDAIDTERAQEAIRRHLRGDVHGNAILAHAQDGDAHLVLASTSSSTWALLAVILDDGTSTQELSRRLIDLTEERQLLRGSTAKVKGVGLIVHYAVVRSPTKEVARVRLPEQEWQSLRWDNDWQLDVRVTEQPDVAPQYELRQKLFGWSPF